MESIRCGFCDKTEVYLEAGHWVVVSECNDQMINIITCQKCLLDQKMWKSFMANKPIRLGDCPLVIKTIKRDKK